MTATASVRAHLVPIGEIVAGLAERIEALCAELFPAGKRVRDEFVFAGGDSRLGCSGQVRLVGAKRGIWVVWHSYRGGDALDLVAEVKFDGDKSAAVKWALGWLGYDPGRPEYRPSPAPAPQKSATNDQDFAAAEQRRSAAARAIWLAARPSLRDSPAERYLLGRGIDLGRLGRQPRALRFHPQLGDGRRDDPATRYWPALVAAVVPPAGGATVAVHRIFLTAEGRKAPIFDAKGDNKCKSSFGPKKGGLVPLCRGSSGRALRDAPAGSAIWLSEGIEDGLAIALLTGGAERVAAAIDLGNIGALELPPAYATVILAGQNDPWWAERSARLQGGLPEGRPHGAAKGLDRAIRHFQAQGRQVLLWRPPEIPGGAGCKDANDYLQFVQSEGRAA